MVAAVDDGGVLGETGFLEGSHDLADIVIKPADKPVIGDKGTAAFRRVGETRFRIHHRILFFHPGVALIAGIGMKFRVRKIHPVIEVIEGLWTDKRKMWRHQPDI